MNQVLPVNQIKRRRIDGNDSASNAVGEGIIELDVLSISGECMLTLNVSDSMLGRELWKMILDKGPSKPGLQLVVSHTSRLMLHESLQQQGLGGQRAEVSATYMPVNLHAAWRFGQGIQCWGCWVHVEQELQKWQGLITKYLPCCDNLPNSLRTLTFAGGFDRETCWPEITTRPSKFDFWNFNLIRVWTRWHGRKVFKVWLLIFIINQSLDNVTWPAGLQSVTFGRTTSWSEPGQCDMASWPSKFDFWTPDSIRAWTMWYGQLAFKVWLLDIFSIRAWTTWYVQPAFISLTVWYRTFNQNLDNGDMASRPSKFDFWSETSIKRLDNVRLPASLQSLTFDQRFNQSLDNVRWPAGLQNLTFGWQISIRAWTTWHGQQAFKAWLLVG